MGAMKIRSRYHLIAALALAALVAACSASQPPPQGADSQPEERCTTEAKPCPDGSMVGRTEPHCAFAACPGPPSLGAEPPGR